MVMKRKKKLSLTLIGILFVFSAMAFTRFVPWKSRVTLSGTVVGSKLAQPIVNAKVFVVLRRKGFPYHSYSVIGIRTDRSGQFSLDLEAPRRYHDIIVEASTPSNEYGRKVANASDDVTVATSPLPAALHGVWGFEYSTFRGSFTYGRDPDLHFIGKGWSIDRP